MNISHISYNITLILASLSPLERGNMDIITLKDLEVPQDEVINRGDNEEETC
tara:strand:+ start:896 stop:1051 length:156 start_codon:yes stop_codon:yes gene_type:complete